MHYKNEVKIQALCPIINKDKANLKNTEYLIVGIGDSYHQRIVFAAATFTVQKKTMIEFLKKLLGIAPGPDFKALKASGALIVDVRTPEEFRSGHFKGAENIPLDKIRKEIPVLQKKKKVIILYCRSGSRSGMAKNMLRAAGIEAYNAGSLGAIRRALA
jgi:phage shock protein E